MLAMTFSKLMNKLKVETFFVAVDSGNPAGNGFFIEGSRKDPFVDQEREK